MWKRDPKSTINTFNVLQEAGLSHILDRVHVVDFLELLSYMPV